ncbi:hypothetical protein BKA69DRAFT_1036428 [Paraphysoderma sedebokerense]|nr:hypothetical protein BKA69DRAFT_1036428 [Paraphysoderma sedebokerense]
MRLMKQRSLLVLLFTILLSVSQRVHANCYFNKFDLDELNSYGLHKRERHRRQEQVGTQVQSQTRQAAASNTSTLNSTVTSATPASRQTPIEISDEENVIDARVPAGRAKFVIPLPGDKPSEHSVIPAGSLMNISWVYEGVRVAPRLITLQMLPAIINNRVDVQKQWIDILVNQSVPDNQYIWEVPGSTPEGRGYVIRVFDSNLGPGTIRPGRLRESHSGRFAVYKERPLGPVTLPPLEGDAWSVISTGNVHLYIVLALLGLIMLGL